MKRIEVSVHQIERELHYAQEMLIQISKNTEEESQMHLHYRLSEIVKELIEAPNYEVASQVASNLIAGALILVFHKPEGREIAKHVYAADIIDDKKVKELVWEGYQGAEHCGWKTAGSGVDYKVMRLRDDLFSWNWSEDDWHSSTDNGSYKKTEELGKQACQDDWDKRVLGWLI